MIMDTSFIIDFLNGEKKAVERLKNILDKHEALKTTAISVFEIWQGIRDLKNQEKRTKIESFLSSIGLIDFDVESAKKAGTIYGNLKAKGALIEGYDCMIAAIALSRNESLLTRNKKHFKRIVGLEIESY